MKKAKEYAHEILAANVISREKLQECLTDTIVSLYNEYKELEGQRNIIRIDGVSYLSMLNLLKEFHVKWVSISNRVNKQGKLLDNDIWLEFVKETMPGLYPNLLNLMNNRELNGE